jgi:hypothetical protein
MAASVALLAAACSPSPSNVDHQSTAAPTSTADVALTAGTTLISDGTATVTIGGRAVTFPGPVTDAAWSPDGSRIVYIDGDGNVATAHPDGSGVLVLTTKNAAVVRSRPAWSRDFVFYAEKKGNTSTLMAVPANGCGPNGTVADGAPWDMDTGPGTSYVDLAPSAAFSFKPARVAFQHVEPGGPEIWINDTNQRTPITVKVTKGSEPALSPDGQRLAYVGTSGQIFLTAPRENGGAGVQVTFGADHPTRLAWTPDGQHIAYETPKDIESVGVSPGANSNPATTISPKPGVPAFLAAKRDTVARISGPDPIALSIAVSQTGWPSEPQFAYGQGYPGAFGAVITAPGQALGAAGRAHSSAGPLLLTTATTLDPRTKAELQRLFGTLFPDGPKPHITIVGNEVSTAVDQQLKALGYDVIRATGVAVPDLPSGDCGPQKDSSLFRQALIIVDTSSATDNGAATAMASTWGVPILRLHSGLDDTAKAFLARSAPSIENVYIVDSAGAVSADVTKQIGDLISGPGGYDTPTNPLYVAP